MRRESDGHRSAGPCESNRGTRECIDVRSLNPRISVASKMVGSQSVNGYDDDVWVRVRGPKVKRPEKEERPSNN